ncbi:MAG: hypothetical protein IPM15_22860 [Betaproteobacteria bacterium]|nr:hypothetical protein [Betaproteobacteria bacterium]
MARPPASSTASAAAASTSPNGPTSTHRGACARAAASLAAGNTRTASGFTWRVRRAGSRSASAGAMNIGSSQPRDHA